MITRRELLAAAALTMTGADAMPDGFVRLESGRFTLGGKRYGAYLGAEGPTGDRARLKHELDLLKSLGVTNLRVLGASELSPLKNSLRPAFRDSSSSYNEDLLGGLDFLLAEMAERNMKAVVFLNNFWEWSGGMVTYLYWVNGGHYIDLGDPAHPWPEFADFSAQFYANEKANALYREYATALLRRTNTISGRAYRNDPTIMAWELANEPRAGGNADRAPYDAFYAWVSKTADFVKTLAPNHLVTTGSEGLKGCLESEECVLRAHAASNIDYMTFHIWPLNWSWINPSNMEGGFPSCATKTKDYIASHERMAVQLKKPAVIEEFGFPRNGGLYAPGVSAAYRDQYYSLVFEAVENSARTGGPIAGSNFWAWGGLGRAQHDDFLMRSGETGYAGDPPQEPQGRNSVFDSDTTTIAIIRKHAAVLKHLHSRS